MNVTYGPGVYVQGTKHYEGTIILAEHKLYLKGAREDLAQTYIPLEKIVRLKKFLKGVEIEVRLSIANQYVALFQGESRCLSELVNDLVDRLGLRKKFLKPEWISERRL